MNNIHKILSAMDRGGLEKDAKDQLKALILGALPEEKEHRVWCNLNVKEGYIECTCDAESWNAYKREAEKKIEELFT